MNSGVPREAKRQRAFGVLTESSPDCECCLLYLETLRRKPGAVRNSAALKAIPKLKAIFDTHYAGQPKKFIELFMENKDLPVKELIRVFEEKVADPLTFNALDVVVPPADMDVAARTRVYSYGALVNAGIRKEGAGNVIGVRAVGAAEAVSF